MEHTGFAIIGNWFHIYFIENEGMAFGMVMGGDMGKLFLSCFRIIFSIAIIYYLYNLVKQKASNGLIICVSLILAGALGNIIDSVFYGVIFTDSHGHIATFLPDQGYAGWLHGRVVDMLYFPMIEGTYPSWFPIIGGKEFIFFQFIFNIADSAITTGILILILFQKYWFPERAMSQEKNIENLTSPEIKMEKISESTS